MTTSARPMTPALMPVVRAPAVPRVAETWVWLISLRLIGRAPICSDRRQVLGLGRTR